MAGKNMAAVNLGRMARAIAPTIAMNITSAPMAIRPRVAVGEAAAKSTP